jgi:hypothetical protein
MKDVYKDNDTFTEYMESKYPEMFSKEYRGFCIGSGWYPIIDVLCNNIQNRLMWKNCEKEKVPQVIVTQVKEKLGGLRFYYDGGDDVIHGMVQIAESMSEITCEECGAPGEARGGGWIQTLCDTHAKAREI